MRAHRKMAPHAPPSLSSQIRCKALPGDGSAQSQEGRDGSLPPPPKYPQALPRHTNTEPVPRAPFSLVHIRHVTSVRQGKLVLSRNRPRTKGHSVIPAPRTTETQEPAASSVWLSRTLLNPIMSGLADASGTSGPHASPRFMSSARHPDGSHIMPIFVLVGKSLCGGVAEQFLRKGGGYHGSVSHRLPQPLVDRLTGECHKLAEIFQFEGFWGVDFLVQEGEPFLVDLNSGRYCGAHGAKLYTELHAPGRPFKYFFEELPPDGPDAATLTRRLRAHQLEFTAASGHGVAVLLALPGVGGEDGRFLAVGWDMADLQRISDAFQAHCGDILAPA